MSKELALLGGPKTIEAPFTPYKTMGPEENEAAKAVIDSGILSKYIGGWTDDFYGGPKVKEFEKSCCDYFNVKHAITVNSWTSGLMAAVGALDVEPGDEIIVTPWTMCASATAILVWNCIPVFADIDPQTFCIDPESVRKNITSRTKAIMAVDIFGQSADMVELRKIADEYNLKIISDTAQAPGAKVGDQFAGTFADIGGYSLNYHKHIHTGEGGVLVTNDDRMADRLQLIRNHAEAVVGPKGNSELNNMIGFNFRLGEIECAIGVEQLKKLDDFVESRQRAAKILDKGLARLNGLQTPHIPVENSHVYYTYPLVLDTNALGVSRDRIHQALTAEGLGGVAQGYQNVHLLPMYQQKQAYGSKGFPWTADFADWKGTYDKGICPMAEELHDNTFMYIAMCLYELRDEETHKIVETFQKVWSQLDRL